MKNGRINKNFYYFTGIDTPGYVYVFDMQEHGENGKLFAPEQVKELEELIEEAKTAKKRLILSAFSSDFNQKYFYQTPFLNADSMPDRNGSPNWFRKRSSCPLPIRSERFINNTKALPCG
jgi:hypothetical protein